MEDMTLEMGFEPRLPRENTGTEESSFPAASGRGPRRGRILVMDDDRQVRDMLRRQLAVFGFEVEVFADGRDAAEAYLRARDGGMPYDAVILDLVVNGGWGGERTLAEIRKVDAAVKAMVCSGAMSRPAEAYRQQGFSAVLEKPYSLGDLRLQLEEMLS
jgi:DNA-binding NtrC family response regulator